MKDIKELIANLAKEEKFQLMEYLKFVVNEEIEKFDIYIRKRNYQIQKPILEKAMVLGVFKTKELLDEERKVIVKKEEKLKHKNRKEKEL